MNTDYSNKNKRIAKNVIYMYIRMIIMTIVSLYTTRIVLRELGIDDYGIYNIVGGIVVLFSFINQGLTGATKRYIMEQLAVGDILSQKKIYSVALNSHVLLSIFIFLVGEIFCCFFFNQILNIPNERVGAATLAFQMSLLTAITGVLLSPYNSIIISFEKMSAYAYFSVADALMKLGVAFALSFFSGDKLIAYSVLLLVVNIVDIIIYYSYCRYNFEMCRYIVTRDKKIYISLFQYVGWTFYGLGANVLSRQGVNILLNNYFSVSVNAAMGICDMIVSKINMMIDNVQVAFSPQLTKNYISRDFNYLNELILRSSRYSSILILLFFLPLCVLIKDFLGLWLNNYPKYTEEFCILTLCCLYFQSISSPLTMVITSDRKIGFYQRMMSLMYLITFIMSWILLIVGILPYYVLIARLFIDISIMLVRLQIVNKKVDSFSIIKWSKEVLLNGFFILASFSPSFILITFIETNSGWIRFFSNLIIAASATIIAIFYLGLNENERKMMIQKISKSFHHE